MAYHVQDIITMLHLTNQHRKKRESTLHLPYSQGSYCTGDEPCGLRASPCLKMFFFSCWWISIILSSVSLGWVWICWMRLWSLGQDFKGGQRTCSTWCRLGGGEGMLQDNSVKKGRRKWHDQIVKAANVMGNVVCIHLNSHHVYLKHTLAAFLYLPLQWDSGFKMCNLRSHLKYSHANRFILFGSSSWVS